MVKKILRLTALVLALCLLLTGCGMLDTLQKIASVYGLSATSFEDMQYDRPDMEALEAALQTCTELSQTAGDVDVLMDAVYDFYDLYDLYYTNYVLADIHYSCDITDDYWKAEYTFCAEAEPSAEAMLEQMFCDLADSPLREDLEQEDFFGPGFFDDYEDEPVMNKKLVKLLEQEAALENRYYDLSDQHASADFTLNDEVYRQTAELYVDLIRIRQEISDYLGYPNYPELAYDMYYSRDYYPAEAERYMEQIGQTLHDHYLQLQDSDIWEQAYGYCKEAEAFRYVKKAAAAMGGTIEEAFQLLERNDLYDISYSSKKMDTSFETYIWNYYAPFVFVNPYLDHTDKLTFAHEFGHFAADYACSGTYSGTDIAEVHSQTMEYLTLCYGQDTQMLTRYKLADSLCIYMEQSAFSLFEHRVYDLRGEDLTVENVEELYRQTGIQFGFDTEGWNPREYVTILHLYTDPLYMISYVVSNDLAMQFYQMELEKPYSGLELYESSLTSQESYILAFAEDNGLQSPFDPGRPGALRELFTDIDF